jgi:hypothetical protein
MEAQHLRRILTRYFAYDHPTRTHLSLGKDAPGGRPIEPAGRGAIISIPEVGGSHHRYVRGAASSPRPAFLAAGRLPLSSGTFCVLRDAVPLVEAESRGPWAPLPRKSLEYPS